MDVKTLYIFDFDNTLVTSDDEVSVLHKDNTKTILTTRTYLEYKKQDGDAFDYSNFVDSPLKNPVPTKLFNYFLEILKDSCKENTVVILTSRGFRFPVINFLEKYTNKLPGIICLGCNGPDAVVSKKIEWIKTYLRVMKSYFAVKYFDDHSETCCAVLELSAEYRDKDFEITLVKEKK